MSSPQEAAASLGARFPRAVARAAAAGSRMVVRASTGSTNRDLLDEAERTPHLGGIVTLDQRAGRGRLNRSFGAPPGTMLAVSLLVRADLSDRDRGWVPLVAGMAVRDAVASLLPSESAEGAPDARATVKWPNDVLVDERKISGILCQVAPDGSIVVGAGVNLTIPADALPTPQATSLTLAGAVGTAADLADSVLERFWNGLRAAIEALEAGGARSDGVRDEVRARCGTLGRRVRVELPDGAMLEGEAVGLSDDGRITIRNRRGEDKGVSVGDITHLRYA